MVAQTGSLAGTVSDLSGGVVPGAVVVIAGADGHRRQTVSGADGTYGFTSVPYGTYKVHASAPQMELAEQIEVSIGSARRNLDLELRVVLASQNVAVQATTYGAISTDSSANASATIIAGKDLDALADDPNDLAADLQALAGPSAGPNGGQVFIDGFSGGVLPSKDSIREVRINQNPF